MVILIRFFMSTTNATIDVRRGWTDVLLVYAWHRLGNMCNICTTSKKRISTLISSLCHYVQCNRILHCEPILLVFYLTFYGTKYLKPHKVPDCILTIRIANYDRISVQINGGLFRVTQ